MKLTKKTIFIIAGTVFVLGIIGAASSSKPTTVAKTVKTQAPLTTKQQVGAWNAKYGSAFTTLSTDFGQISKDSANPDTSVIQADCQQLKLDVANITANPAIPEPTIEQHWSSMLSYDNTGAQDCIDGVSTTDSALISKATTEFGQANTELTATSKAIVTLQQQ